MYFSTPSGCGIFPCELLGIFFKGWDEYPVLKTQESLYTSGNKSAVTKVFSYLSNEKLYEEKQASNGFLYFLLQNKNQPGLYS